MVCAHIFSDFELYYNTIPSKVAARTAEVRSYDLLYVYIVCELDIYDVKE